MQEIREKMDLLMDPTIIDQLDSTLTDEDLLIINSPSTMDLLSSEGEEDKDKDKTDGKEKTQENKEVQE